MSKNVESRWWVQATDVDGKTHDFGSLNPVRSRDKAVLRAVEMLVTNEYPAVRVCHEYVVTEPAQAGGGDDA